MTILKKIRDWFLCLPSLSPSNGVLELDCSCDKCKNSSLQLRWEILQLTKEKHANG